MAKVTVAVGQLETTETLFHRFEIECWDSTRTTLQLTRRVQGHWDDSSETYKQSAVVLFTGLTLGTIYSFRTRVLCRDGGPASDWSSWQDETAGDTAAPNPTYSPTTHVTIGGTLVEANPAGAPSDNHHYEFWWGYTGAPGGSRPNYPDSETGIIFLNLVSGESAEIYIRAVDTSGNRQAWTFLATVYPAVLSFTPMVPVGGVGLPINLNASQTGGGWFNFSWDKPPIAGSLALWYDVQIASNTIFSADVLTFTVQTELFSLHLPVTSRYWRVRSKRPGTTTVSSWVEHGSPTSVYSGVDSGRPTDPPAHPTINSATVFGGTVRLALVAPSGVTNASMLRYHWEFNDLGSFPSSGIVAEATTETRLNFDVSVPGQTVWFRVRAKYIDSGYGAWEEYSGNPLTTTGQQYTTPDPPESLSLLGYMFGSGLAQVSWSPPATATSPGYLEYHIEIATTSGYGGSTVVDQGGINQLYWTGRLSLNTDYWWRVQCRYPSTSWSAWADAPAPILQSTPGKPVSLSSWYGNGAFNVWWKPPTGVASNDWDDLSYNLQADSQSGFTAPIEYSVSGFNTGFASLIFNGKTWYFRVRAKFQSSGFGPWSDTYGPVAGGYTVSILGPSQTWDVSNPKFDYGIFNASPSKIYDYTQRAGQTTASSWATVSSYQVDLPSGLDEFSGDLTVTVVSGGADYYPGAASYQNPTSGGNITGGTELWGDLLNPFTYNNLGATCSNKDTDATRYSYYLFLTEYGFAIPSGDTITGFEVRMRRKETQSSGTGVVRDWSFRLVKNYSVYGASKAFGTDWTAAYTNITYGSQWDLWSGSWLPADVNADGFGVSLQVRIINSGASWTIADVDVIQVRVYTQTDVYIFEGRLKIGTKTSDVLQIVGPTVSGLSTVSVSAPPADLATVEVQGRIVSGGDEAELDVSFDQQQYTDQDLVM